MELSDSFLQRLGKVEKMKLLLVTILMLGSGLVSLSWI